MGEAEMIIKLSPFVGDGRPRKLGLAGYFKVTIGETGIGYSAVRIEFNAHEEQGVLELIRGERDTERGSDVVVENDVEGFGYKLLIRRFKFSSWGIEDGGLVFVNCKRF